MPARRGIECDVEVPERRHHVERVAHLERVVGPVRKHAARIALDGDAQRVVLHRRADRIRAPKVMAVDRRAQREVLALNVAELVVQRRRHGEGDGDRVTGLAFEPGHAQRMELAHASVRLEIVERLEAVEAPVLRLAGGGAELRDELASAPIRTAGTDTTTFAWRNAADSRHVDADDVRRVPHRRSAERCRRRGASAWSPGSSSRWSTPAPAESRATWATPSAASASRIPVMINSVAGHPE